MYCHRHRQSLAEQARNWTHRNQLSKAVGVREEVEPSSVTLDLYPGDVLMLCSDGLHGMVTDDEIHTIIMTAQSAVQAGEVLCAAANRAGGEDNISVAIMAVGDWPFHGGRPAVSEHSASTNPAMTQSHPPGWTQSTRVPRRYPSVRTQPKRNTLHLYFVLALIAFLLGAGMRLLLANKPSRPQHMPDDTKKPAAAINHTNRPEQPVGMSPYQIVISIDHAQRLLTFTEPPDARISYLRFDGSLSTGWNPGEGKYHFSRISSVTRIQDGDVALSIRGTADTIFFRMLPSTRELMWVEKMPAGDYGLYWADDQIAQFNISPSYR